MSFRQITRALAALLRPRRADAEVADEVSQYMDEARDFYRVMQETPGPAGCFYRKKVSGGMPTSRS